MFDAVHDGGEHVLAPDLVLALGARRADDLLALKEQGDTDLAAAGAAAGRGGGGIWLRGGRQADAGVLRHVGCRHETCTRRNQ